MTMPWLLSLFALLALVGLTLPTGAEEHPSRAAVPPAPSGSLEAFGHKARLLERLLENLGQQVNERGPDFHSDLEQARVLFGQARKAMEESRQEDAAALIDAAYEWVTRMSRSLGPARPSQSQLRTRYWEMNDLVNTFRIALIDAAHAKEADIPSQDMAELDALLHEATELAEKKQLEQANRALEAAYQLVATKIATLRSKDTVVHRLELDTPAEEFHYEQKRYYSHDLLVRMVLQERRPTGNIRASVEEAMEAADMLHREAGRLGSLKEFESAVEVEEAAVDQLIQALRRVGIYVPQ